MSLTSYRAAPPRVGRFGVWLSWRCCNDGWIGRPGGDLLSRALRHSTMGAGGFHGRVRDGIGCGPPAMTTRSSNPPAALGVSRGVGPRRRPRRCSGGSWFWCGVCHAGVMREVTLRGLCAGDDFRAWWWGDRAARAIRTGQLRALPHVHIRPIDVMVSHGPVGVAPGETSFRGGFPA
jgi:hypothetical protein